MHVQSGLKKKFFYHFSFLGVWWWAKCCRRTYHRLYVTAHHWLMYASGGRGQQSWAVGNPYDLIMVTVSLIKCLLEQGAGPHIYLTETEVWPEYSIGPLSLWAFFRPHPASSVLSHLRSSVPMHHPTAGTVSRMISTWSGGFSHLPRRADHNRWAVGCSPWAISYGHINHPVWPTAMSPCISTPSKTQRGARSSFHHESLWIFTSEI